MNHVGVESGKQNGWQPNNRSALIKQPFQILDEWRVHKNGLGLLEPRVFLPDEPQGEPSMRKQQTEAIGDAPSLTVSINIDHCRKPRAKHRWIFFLPGYASAMQRSAGSDSHCQIWNRRDTAAKSLALCNLEFCLPPRPEPVYGPRWPEDSGAVSAWEGRGWGMMRPQCGFTGVPRAPRTGNRMNDLAMAGPLQAALAEKGYATLTPVQEAVLKEGVAGRDLLVSAQTGSGKTVAFGVAIAPEVLGGVDRLMPADKPLALVVAPTRELAQQVNREFEWLYAQTGVQLATCVGGMDYRTERRALDRGAHIVVGTPGRLRDHIERGSLDLSGARAVVLDEADEMLDLGFSEDLEFILGSAPEDRRTLMFSATVPKEIEKLARTFQRDALRVVVAGEARQHADIAYEALSVQARDKEHAIFNVLRFHESPAAIVFCKTRANVNHLFARMINRGFQAVALSGELSQQERMHALQALRDGRARVCIATDVAARGIDLPGLELVIHADLPSNSEVLLHRSCLLYTSPSPRD